MGINHFDIILAGGGGAGLSLAYYLSKIKGFDKTVLIIDRDDKKQNDRTWCFWQAIDPDLQHLIYRKWRQIEIGSYKKTETTPLRQYQYQLVRSLDFYRFMHQHLANKPNFEFKTAEIQGINSKSGGVNVQTNQGIYAAKLAFNSIFNWKAHREAYAAKHPYLLQHFVGWRIRTDKPIFNPETARLMDFRTPQGKEARFFYVLPFSPTEALIEYTLFSASLLPEKSYEQAIQTYIKEYLEPTKYEVLEREKGLIPMSTAPFPFKVSPGVYNLGLTGGFAKPSTGYAFVNILKNTRKISEQIAHNQAISSPVKPSRFSFYDAIFLDLLWREKVVGSDIFTRLFFRNAPEQVLRFLDEKTSLLEEVKLFLSLPTPPFLKTAIKLMPQHLNGNRKRH